MAASEIILRPYQPADFETLYRIDQACFPKGIAYSSASLKTYLRSRGSRCLLAEIAGNVTGFILFEQSPEIAHIITLDVLDAYRRQGVGSTLLESAEQFASSRGVQRIYLETATTNKPAIALWKKRGYREVALVKNYYGQGLDAFEMEKILKVKSRVKALS